MTQTVCPLLRQLGHRRPGTCQRVSIDIEPHWNFGLRLTGVERIGTPPLNGELA